MLLPSGDQAKLPTVNAPLVSRRDARVTRSMTNKCVIRWSCSTIWNSPYFFSRSLIDSAFGSVAVQAMLLPSGDQAKRVTPSSREVTASASPPPGSIT